MLSYILVIIISYSPLPGDNLIMGKICFSFIFPLQWLTNALYILGTQ